MDTIILCGITTNIGVESTARDAFERGYSQVFAEDATSARTAEEHEFVMRTTFPRMGRVRSTAEVAGGPGGTPVSHDAARPRTGPRGPERQPDVPGLRRGERRRLQGALLRAGGRGAGGGLSAAGGAPGLSRAACTAGWRRPSWTRPSARAINVADTQTWGVTVEFTVRFRKPVPLDREVRAVGRITRDSSRMFEGTGEIVLEDGSVAVEAQRQVRQDAYRGHRRH